jgi:pimeloyl-ACP methyl ester carboxylesterase
MLRLLLSILLLAFFSQAVAQSFSTGHYTKVFQDPSRNNRNINAEIYYPSDTDGNNVPIAVNGGTFPVVVFGHGFVMTWSAYENVWDALAEAGFIVVFPTTEDGFSPNHTEFGKDIAFLVTALQNEGLLSTSILFNRVASTSAVMGHSMGGGSSFLAIQYNPNITAIANLAAAETNPSAIAACANITIPALVIAGANDCITPPATNQLAMYNALPSNCKSYVSITGGSHCQFANSNFNCNFGELTCSPAPAISRAQQHAIKISVLIPWLNYQLKNDCNAAATFENLIANPSGFNAQKNCVLCPVSLQEQLGMNADFLISSSIAGEFINITSDNFPVKGARIMVIDSKGALQINKTQDFEQGKSVRIGLENLASGIYFVKIAGGKFAPVVEKFVKN